MHADDIQLYLIYAYVWKVTRYNIYNLWIIHCLRKWDVGINLLSVKSSWKRMTVFMWQ